MYYLRSLQDGCMVCACFDSGFRLYSKCAACMLCPWGKLLVHTQDPATANALDPSYVYICIKSAIRFRKRNKHIGLGKLPPQNRSYFCSFVRLTISSLLAIASKRVSCKQVLIILLKCYSVSHGDCSSSHHQQ